MTDSPEIEPSQHRPDLATRAGSAAKVWLRRLILTIVVIALLIGAYFLLAAFVPRWWAQQVGHAVNGSMGTGIGLGLLVGIAFTALPVLLLLFAARRVRTHTVIAAVIALLAVVLAIPNLLTLAVVAGGGSGAHAGERIMDVEAPMFRGASLAGVLVGLLLGFVVFAVLALWRSRRMQRKLDKAAIKAQKKADKEAAKQQRELAEDRLD